MAASPSTPTRSAARRTGKRTAKAHRKLQKRRAVADSKRPPLEAEAAMQAGARHYPVPPLPRQHHRKPGRESRLDPPPMFEAPYWKGSFKLLDRVALITGGDSGIGRAVAILFAREGADIAIVHLDEPEDAEVTRRAVEAEGRRCLVMAGDVSRRAFCASVVARTVKELGGLDVLVNNAAFQLHAARIGVADTPVTDCTLERWREAGSREGEAARDRLAAQVETALKVLGSGFLEANPDLAARLKSGEVNLTKWFNELLRLVYRLIFLMVAEDRNLLHPETAKPESRKLYVEGYSLTALRAQCVRAATWDKHYDRYEGIKVVFQALAHGQQALGLPALGGLFGTDMLPHLETARLRNRAFMEALYRLSWLSDKTGIVPVNWRAMETEELGSVYETLLELQPQLGDDGKTLLFASEVAEQRGNQRKTTGSYYTPDSLVQLLLDTTLNPVLDDREAQASDPAEELLKLTVIDPACGSGHFLLAAARRIATRVARHRAGGIPSAADFRHALREVACRCLYGVDRNPMAVELTKVALWIEALEPGRPLAFFDAQIRCGDSLIGVLNRTMLREGLPDEAYKPLTGDDKELSRRYARLNKEQRDRAKGHPQLF